MSVVFVVQGEGRGHMTQALAMASILRDAGHELSRVMVGRSPYRPVPAYFRDRIGAPLLEFDAPTQVSGTDRRGLSVGRTLVDAVRRSPEFLRSTRTIAWGVEGADIVLNFLELLGGLSRRRFPSSQPWLGVAHNYLFLHPELNGIPGPAHRRRTVLAYARATAAGTHRKLALSFEEMPSRPTLALEVTPPLLRPGLDSLEVRDDGYLLAYALNPGYGERLAHWQSRSPGAVVHCFVEGGERSLPDTGPGFHAHDLDDHSFLHHLAGCRAYVGSAGFESLCEAHYLGKPVLAVPTEGQFEQTLNAWDAERCGVAQAGEYRDLNDFWTNLPTPSTESVQTFRRWVSRGPQIFVDAVERTAHTSIPPAYDDRLPGDAEDYGG